MFVARMQNFFAELMEIIAQSKKRSQLSGYQIFWTIQGKFYKHSGVLLDLLAISEFSR